MKRFLVHAVVAFALVAFVGFLGVVSGLVPIAASSGHWGLTEWFLHFAMQKSVGTHSFGIEAPKLDDPRLVTIGAGHYEGGCRPCHGAPGRPMPVVPQFMTPKAPKLEERVGQYSDAELFYVVRHGVKFTAMPAWPAKTREDEVWPVVAFLRELPKLDEPGYRALVFGSNPQTNAPADAPRVVVDRCARCHGFDGLGREGAFPRLAAQRAEYMREALDAYVRGARHSGIMRPIAAELDAGARDEAVSWYASRPRPPPAADVPPALGETIARHGIPDRRIPACVGCHGPGDAPKHAGYPRLAGQWPEYLALQLRLFTKQARGGASFVELMKEAVTDHALGPDEIDAVARYYASLSD